MEAGPQPQPHFPTKYQQLFTPQELDLLDYNPLIEGDEFQYVYKPNDDTFLILSTLKHELELFPQDAVLCEVGSGSGIISANLNNWLYLADKRPIVHVSIDLNMDASMLSKKYYDKYDLNIQQINTSTFNNTIFTEPLFTLKPEVVIFNPPYVPVEQQQIENQHKYLVEKLKYVRENSQSIRNKEQNLIAYSYMGGVDGLQITRKILGRINWKCTIYFIVMGHEGVESIKKQIEQRTVLNPSILSSEFQTLQYAQFWNEDLYVIKVKLSNGL